jgi:recombination protein RecR
MSEQILEKLIKKVSRLPGLGPRSSRRVVLHLLKNKEKYLLPLINDLSQVADNIKSCNECGNLDQDDVCEICKNPLRKNNLICVVETVADL